MHYKFSVLISDTANPQLHTLLLEATPVLDLTSVSMFSSAAGKLVAMITITTEDT